MHAQPQNRSLKTEKGTHRKFLCWLFVAIIVLVLELALYSIEQCPEYVEHDFQGVLVEKDGMEREIDFTFRYPRSNLVRGWWSKKYNPAGGELQVASEDDFSIYTYYFSSQPLVNLSEGDDGHDKYKVYREGDPYCFIWAFREVPGGIDYALVILDSVSEPRNIIVKSEKGYQFYSSPMSQSFRDMVEAQKPVPRLGSYVLYED